MTPQLQQAIKLLQLSNIELAAYIEGELEQNPLLERDDAPAEEGAEAVPAPAEPATPGETTHAEAVEAWHEIAGCGGRRQSRPRRRPERLANRAARGLKATTCPVSTRPWRARRRSANTSWRNWPKRLRNPPTASSALI